MRIRELGFLIMIIFLGSCQKPGEQSLSSQGPSACLPTNVNADPTVSSAQSYNFQCTQKYCGSFGRACDASKSQVCSSGICVACSSGQNACPMAPANLPAQYKAQLDS